MPDGLHTWIPITYTQTFAATYLDPWPSPQGENTSIATDGVAHQDGGNGEAVMINRRPTGAGLLVEAGWNVLFGAVAAFLIACGAH